jgi:hypothetical protein
MFKIFAVGIFLTLAVAVFADIDNKCLGCICKVESNCQPIGCHMDRGSLSCGYYQIKQSYWTDCGRPGSSLAECGNNKACSDECVHAYMKRYGTYCTGGRAPTCEDYARIHNGGPNGCKESATIPYWNKVKACYG